MKPIVLLVEGDPDLEELVQTLITEYDSAAVAVARNTKEARLVVREVNPALIVIDDDLPQDPCEGLLGFIRATQPTTHIPLVVLVDKPGRGRELIRMGANAFLPKDFNVEMLLDLIKFFTERGQTTGHLSGRAA